MTINANKPEDTKLQHIERQPEKFYAIDGCLIVVTNDKKMYALRVLDHGWEPLPPLPPLPED